MVGQYLHSSVFSLAGSSSVGKDRDTVCTQFITQIFTSTAASAPGLTTPALEHGFPLVGTGKYLLFTAHHVTGRACASANPAARVRSSHQVSPSSTVRARDSVTAAPAPLPAVPHTVPCQHGAVGLISCTQGGAQGDTSSTLTCRVLKCQLQLPKDRNGVVESISYTDTLPPLQNST